MVRPDYMDFISHSAKGTTWKDHKYIKKINGIYYYAKDKIDSVLGERDKRNYAEEIVNKERELNDLELDMWEKMKKIMNDYEIGQYFDKDGETPIYFDKDDPENADNIDANLQKAISGDYSGYSNEKYREINKLANKYNEIKKELDKIKEDQKKDKDLKHSLVNYQDELWKNFYYLSHGGPGSGRYPWGSGDRPYQRLEKGKQHRGIMGYVKAKKAQKAEEQLQKDMAEARKRAAAEEERKKRLEADKERVLRAGSAREVLQYQGMLTNKELQDAYSRIDWEKRLSSIAASEIQTNMQKMDKAMSNLKTINNWGSTLTDSYNLMAAVYNATKEGKKDPWPEIKKGGGIEKKKK